MRHEHSASAPSVAVTSISVGSSEGKLILASAARLSAVPVASKSSAIVDSAFMITIGSRQPLHLRDSPIQLTPGVVEKGIRPRAAHLPPRQLSHRTVLLRASWGAVRRTMSWVGTQILPPEPTSAALFSHRRIGTH